MGILNADTLGVDGLWTDPLWRVEVALTASRAAAAALAAGAEDRRRLASIAKAVCSESLQHVAAETVQLHGGIAITWEHDAHLYFKRAHGCAQLFGQPREHFHALEAAAGLTS